MINLFDFSQSVHTAESLVCMEVKIYAEMVKIHCFQNHSPIENGFVGTSISGIQAVTAFKSIFWPLKSAEVRLYH